MSKHSPARANFPILPGLGQPMRGKVRDTYNLPDNKLLSVASDGISIFDFVLNATVPEKGSILNALNHFWLQYFAKLGFETHFVAAGPAIANYYLPNGLEPDADLQSRAMVIKKLSMAPVEFIARAVLTGSAVGSYAENGQVCGHKLPSGLQDGDELPYILDTPTSKAEAGHDEHLPASRVREAYPYQTYLLLQMFQIASNYAGQRGIKIADAKVEFGIAGTIGDEIFTPDSSRFWEMQTWLDGREVATGRKAPPSYDKQIVRIWGIGQGINTLNPEKPDDVAQAHAMVVPEGLIRQTTKTYRYMFWRLIGQTRERYLRDVMGIDVKPSVKNIAIICGSETDLPAVRAVLPDFPASAARIAVHVMSCHRNPDAVEAFAASGCGGVDAVIAVGGKAFALPGILDAFIHANGLDVPVIGVALGNPGSRSFEAAKLSIEELPGTPVVIDEFSGHCYCREEGLSQAITRVITGELPPPKPRLFRPVLAVGSNF